MINLHLPRSTRTVNLQLLTCKLTRLQQGYVFASKQIPSSCKGNYSRVDQDNASIGQRVKKKTMHSCRTISICLSERNMRTKKRLPRSESQTKMHIWVAWQSHKMTNNWFDEISWDLEKISLLCDANSLFYPSVLCSFDKYFETGRDSRNCSNFFFTNLVAMFVVLYRARLSSRFLKARAFARFRNQFARGQKTVWRTVHYTPNT